MTIHTSYSVRIGTAQYAVLSDTLLIYRRAAIAEAFGLVSSYRSNFERWEQSGKKGRSPSVPQAGFVSPAMYRDNCFVRTGTYTARIKVWMRNTWDWMEVTLRKCDVDYILRRCSGRKECVPTLRNKGKVWSLDFSFEEKVKLNASYNIGARYFIRKLLKSVTATRRLHLEAKVPSVCRRSTCTLSDLISLHAVLAA